jgi:hypothetical protein
MPAAEVEMFQKNVSFARSMAASATALEAQLTAAVDVSDLLRAALVQAVSAFDHYIHEEVRVRMLTIVSEPVDSWPSAFRRFRVQLIVTRQIVAGRQEPDWLQDEVIAQHGHLAFQHPDKVADALRLVSDVELWPTVATHLGVSADEARTRLKLIVDRRNKIAHEADTDPTPPRTRFPISRGLVDDSIDFLENLAGAISASL